LRQEEAQVWRITRSLPSVRALLRGTPAWGRQLRRRHLRGASSGGASSVAGAEKAADESQAGSQFVSI